MSLRRGVRFLLLVAGLGVPGPAPGQTIQGVLRNRDNDEPVSFARLYLITESGDSVASSSSSSTGTFRITAPGAGSFYLSAGALGFRSTTVGVFDLGDDGEMTVQFRIAPDAIVLDGIDVEVEGLVRDGMLIRNGFYERLRSGLGQFITPADIMESDALRATDLLLDIPRVEVVDGGIGGDRIELMSPLGACGPPIYVDNVLVSRDGSDFDMVVPLVAVEAIEVYRGAAETPLQWGGTNGGCGAIVVWTKR